MIFDHDRHDDTEASSKRQEYKHDQREDNQGLQISTEGNCVNQCLDSQRRCQTQDSHKNGEYEHSSYIAGLRLEKCEVVFAMATRALTLCRFGNRIADADSAANTDWARYQRYLPSESHSEFCRIQRRVTTSSRPSMNTTNRDQVFLRNTTKYPH